MSDESDSKAPALTKEACLEFLRKRWEMRLLDACVPSVQAITVGISQIPGRPDL